MFYVFLVSFNAHSRSRDNPILIQCDGCYSHSSFLGAAKQANPNNSVNYYLVYNMNSEEAKTILAVDVYEPYEAISFSQVDEISTSPILQQEFNEYVAWAKGPKDAIPQVPKKVYEVPASKGTSYDGVIYHHVSDVNQFLDDNFGTFYAGYTYIVTMKFDNGDVIKVLVKPRLRFIELISAEDKYGKDISSRARDLMGGVYLGAADPVVVGITSSNGTSSTVITCTCELWAFADGIVNGSKYIIQKNCTFKYSTIQA